MTSPQHDWPRLGEYVREARRTHYNIEQVIREAEVARGTWKRLEDGLPVRDDTLRAAERVLGWNPGDAWRVLEGGEPLERPGTKADEEIREMVERATHLSAEHRELVFGLIRTLTEGDEQSAGKAESA